jgi:transposase
MITGRMDTTTTSNDFKLLEIVDTGRRRRFSVDAKRRIVEESFVSGDSVSAVARRHGLLPAQLFAWRRAARDGRFGVWCGDGDGAGFVAAQVVPDVGPRDVERGHVPGRSHGRMEVVSANGRRVIVDREVDVEALVGIIRALETLS